ncbi:MAG: hypothetical protein GVY16_06310 [Planctomycetes bacterium]|nr:hypothetical protein [Planctomycetota bacterium]
MSLSNGAASQRRPATPKPRPPSPKPRLSTNERQDVQDDPAVQSVLSLFDGDLSDIDAGKTIQASQTDPDTPTPDEDVEANNDD